MSDPEPPPSDEPAAVARRLLREADRAVLSTALAGAEGWPFGSLVLLATDAEGVPLLLLSDLAEHTRNLERDPRASLLVDGTAGYEDPLTGPRVTVIGRIERSAEAGLAERYLTRHPSAALYAGFKDFHFYRLLPARAHLVAGFGQIHWIEGSSLLGESGG